MPDTTQFPRPARIDTQLPLGLTYPDLARIAVPAAVGGVTAGPVGAVLGTAAGTGLTRAWVDGKKPDHMLRDVAGYITETRFGQWPAVYVDKTSGVMAGNGAVTGVVAVDAVDIEFMSDSETAAVLETVNNAFKTVDAAVELHSRQRRVDLDRFAGVDGSTVVTDHYVIVRVRTEGDDWRLLNEARRDELVDRVQDRCDDVERALSGGGISADHLTGSAFATAVRRLCGPPRTVRPRHYVTGTGEVRKIIVVDGYPSEMQVAWLGDILDADVPGMVDVVQRVEPVLGDRWKRLQQVLSKTRAERVSTQRPARQAELTRLEQDIEDLIEVRTAGEPLLEYAVCIVVRGPDSDVVDTSIDRLRPVLEQHQVAYGVPWLQTRNLVKHCSPVFDTGMDTDLVLPGLAAAAGFPMAARDTVDEHGVVFGTDEAGVPVVLDRFGWSAPSPHMTVLGMTGAGKTYWMKLQLLRSAARYDDLQVLVADLKPDPEYDAVVDALHCAVDRWAIGEEMKDDDDLLSSVLRHVYDASRTHAGPSIVVVDEAHKVLHDDAGRQELADLVQMGRSENIAVTLLTQAASHFTAHGEAGESMLRQMGCYVFFRQQDVRTEVERFFRFTSGESSRLHGLATGDDDGFSEAMLRGPVNCEVQVSATPREEAAVLGDDAK